MRARVAASWCLVALAGCGSSDTTGSGGGAAGATTAASSSAAASGTGGGAVPPPVCDPGAGGAPAGFHAATDGTPAGDGSATAPWDLATALLAPPGVQPGDTIWLHGGVYAGGFVAKLDGAEGAPITVRSWPGEWATIDGQGTTEPTLQIYHHDVTFQDLEIMNGDPDRVTDTGRPSGIYVEAKNVKLVHLVVHDTGTGIICNSASDTDPELAPELEVYGCILYDNGWEGTDNGHGHDLYIQNRDGTKHLRDNLLFDSFGGFGIHAYSDNDTHWVQGYEITGNVWWGPGVATSGASKIYDGCLVGHNGTHPVARVTLTDNFGWARPIDERDLRLGWSADNEDVKLQNNYLVGQTIFQQAWQSIEMVGNTFIGPLSGVDPAAFPGNTYLASAPAETKIVVRPSQYEPGRAHIVVYNWGQADTVDVDVGSVLAAGVPYEVRSAQDFFGPPVATGNFDGKPITLPMTGTAVAQPIGAAGAILPQELPGKDFQVFVLLGACGR